MNHQTESKLNRMADEVHLISTPVRILSDWIKILVFIAVLPIVFVASVLNWLFTGARIMSPDEVWLTKILLTVLSPWITTLIYLCRKHWRAARGRRVERPIPSAVIFFGTIIAVLVLVRCSFYFGWGFYNN